jgi:hypothetical protein
MSLAMRDCTFFAVYSEDIQETLSVYYSGETEGYGGGGEEVSVW